MSRQVNEYYGKYSYEICVSSFLLLPFTSLFPPTYLSLSLSSPFSVSISLPKKAIKN